MRESFGGLFRWLRQEAGRTQRELADVLEVSHTYISKIENDRTALPPSEKFLRQAAGQFGIAPDEMIALSGRTVEIPIAENTRLRSIEAAARALGPSTPNYIVAGRRYCYYCDGEQARPGVWEHYPECGWPRFQAALGG